MKQLHNIAVFCGSNLGCSDVYAAAATALGSLLARSGHKIIFGGGKIGLMGTLARAAINEGGAVTGIIPQFLKAQEMAFGSGIELITVTDMAARKDKMIAMADAFIVLPGGIGTYEEVFEVLSRLQLRQINKPLGFLNTADFFAPFTVLMTAMAAAGFIPAENKELFCLEDDAEKLLAAMAVHRIPAFNKRLRV